MKKIDLTVNLMGGVLVAVFVALLVAIFTSPEEAMRVGFLIGAAWYTIALYLLLKKWGDLRNYERVMEMQRLARLNLDSLAASIAQWNKEQFPGGDLRAKVKHLAKEVAELQDRPYEMEEWVDVFFFFACAFQHFGPYRMIRAIDKKLYHNKYERQWPAKPDADGVYEHVRQ